MPVRSEDGSALVELVFVVTILFAMLFGMLDFALIQASDNAGSNAAREGARQAIVDYACADTQFTNAQPTTCTTSSDALQRITTKVSSRLGGLTAGTPVVTVECWDGTAGTAKSEKKCDPAGVVPGVDLIEVDVTWKRLATTPYGTVTTHTDNAVMTVQGSGQGTRATSCQISPAVAPSSVALSGTTSPGTLASDVVLTVPTNGFCQPLFVSFTPNATTQGPFPMCFNQACTATAGTTFYFTIKGSDYSWAAGTHNLNLSELGTYPLSPTHAPTLTVSTASSCTVTAASVNPTTDVLEAGTGARTLKQPVNLSVTTSSSSACTGLKAVFNTNGGADLIVAMTGTAPSFTLAVDPTYTWTSGSKLFTFTDTAGIPVTTPASVLLAVGDPCTVLVVTDPSTFGHTSNTPVKVTATATPGALCTGLGFTYQYGPGNNQASTAMDSSEGGSTYTFTIPASTNWHAGTWPMSFAIGSTGVPTTPRLVQVTAT